MAELIADEVDRATAVSAFAVTTVAVAVSERQPMGIGRVADQLYLIDDRGGIIDEFGPNYAEFDLPIIDGLAASPGDIVLDAGCGDCFYSQLLAEVVGPRAQIVAVGDAAQKLHLILACPTVAADNVELKRPDVANVGLWIIPGGRAAG